ncbi:ABC-type glycerol-3-phosphate transport system, substrate-binding protein [Butyrivibrio hungatei DSM 14810]|uniref:ABC-type glycerol-3-phosphate transport system, substrate-binding protein n=1 Tax=Butyrivibrio hungatei DSM 14810 TaxID=1121132 RepID=A0A1M7SVD5_9FIRM|nr:ABC transporter substrate-binding protein [Butyrivibrio hungatei]SHN62527.1 ABC-type glycerol-3-phosphate transport system, substrate-binding protein [Butyrivibrio hungatei DSM 14810]
MKKSICIILGIITLFLLITGCSKSNVNSTGKKQIVLAMVYADQDTIRKDTLLEDQIALFNQKHNECEIVIKNYYRSDTLFEDGVNLIEREIVSGEGPDIIDYQYEYSKSDIIGQYTEDLYPYIDEDSDLRDSLYMNILDSFAIDKKLYVIPLAYSLSTYVGRKSEIGNVENWDFKTMLDTFDRLGKKYPMGYNTKASIFGELLYDSFDDYIDWENGKSFFDSEEFRSMAEFANTFDYEYNQNMSSFELEDCVVQSIYIANVFDTAIAEGEMQTSDVVYAGYPSKTGCGTLITPGSDTMAISMASKNKEYAWEFIKQLLLPDFQEKLNNRVSLSVNRDVINSQLDRAMKVEMENGKDVVKETYCTSYEFERLPIYSITEKQRDDFVRLVENARISSTNDGKIYEIVCEEMEGYFAGQKSLDECIDNIENRVWIYISEKGK